MSSGRERFGDAILYRNVTGKRESAFTPPKYTLSLYAVCVAVQSGDKPGRGMWKPVGSRSVTEYQISIPTEKAEFLTAYTLC